MELELSTPLSTGNTLPKREKQQRREFSENQSEDSTDTETVRSALKNDLAESAMNQSSEDPNKPGKK